MKISKTHKKIIGFLLLLCLFMSCLMLGGCDTSANTYSSIPTKQKVVWQPGNLFRIGDEQFSKKEMDVYLLSAKNEYVGMYGEEIWNYVLTNDGETVGDRLSEQILQRVIFIKLTCSKAKDYGLYLTEDEITRAKEKAQDYMNTMPTNLFMAGINEETLINVYKDNYLALKVYKKVTDGVLSLIDENEIVKKTFVRTAIRKYAIDVDGNKVQYSPEDCARLEEYARDVLYEARTRSDVVSYLKSVTQDTLKSEITVGRGDLPAEYESMVFDLPTGYFSNIISTEDYYYIFYCLTDNNLVETQKVKEERAEALREAAFDQVYDEWIQNTEIEINEEVWKMTKGK